MTVDRGKFRALSGSFNDGFASEPDNKRIRRSICYVFCSVIAIIAGLATCGYYFGYLEYLFNFNPNRPKNMSDSDFIILNTTLGQIKGNVLTGPSAYTPNNQELIYEFVGIRYGKPPIGDLRFRPCVLNNKTFDDNLKNDIYDATSYGYMCPQPAPYLSKMSEDCLFLNIWTPAHAIGTQNNYNGNGLPVMVFIHGGSFIFGSGAGANGSLFVKQHNNSIIYVSINYRMGVFGFLQSEMLYNEGNSNTYGFNWPSYGGLNGLNDQISAIKWVYQNINNFGGNGENITIFGESAGGQSVCSLLISPLLHDTNLFYQSIIESGPCFGPWQLHPFDVGTKLNKQVLTNGTKYGSKANNLTFLRSLTMEQLLYNVQLTNTVKWPWNQWWPTIDNYILTNDTESMYKAAARNDNDDAISKLNSKRVIWGFNSMDSIIGCPPCPNNSDPNSLKQLLLKFLDNDYEKVNSLVNDYYPVSDYNGNQTSAYYALNSDVCVICPILNINQMFINNKKLKQYVYYFEGTSFPYYAGHGSELIFLLIGTTNPQQSAQYQYGMKFNKTLSQQMINAWQTYANISNLNLNHENGLYTNDSFRFYNPITGETFEWLGYNSSNNGSVLRLNQDVENVYQFWDNQHRHGACKWWFENVDYYTVFNLCSNSFFYNTSA